MNMWSPERIIDIIRIIGIQAHTASIELPIKISSSFTAYPMFRYYTQTASDYFAPMKTSFNGKYYTSDYDLSKFTIMVWIYLYRYFYSAKNLCFRIKINRFTIESIQEVYLSANIGSLGFKFY
jgi:hypothetical protein